MGAINERSIKGLKPGDVLRDEKVRGLHLRAFAEKKCWYLFYRTRSGLQRKPKLGDLNVMDLDTARTMAADMLVKVRAGEDPEDARDTARSSITMTELAQRLIGGEWAKLKSGDNYVYEWTKYVADTRLAKLKVRDVETADVQEVFDRITANNGKTVASRTLGMISVMFSWAIQWKMRDVGTHPIKKKDGAKHALVRKHKWRKLNNYMRPEFAPLIEAELTKREERYPASVAFIRLCMLTGARPIEIKIARWEWVKQDNNDPRIEYPVGSTKTDGLPDIGHVVHLSQAALEVLATLPVTTGTLTGLKDPPKNLWIAVRNAAGCPTLRMYDLRHTAASLVLSATGSTKMVGMSLNHADDRMANRYVHLMTNDARRNVDAIATGISKLTGRTYAANDTKLNIPEFAPQITAPQITCTCAECGNTFGVTKKGQRFCSPRCRGRATVKRRAERAVPRKCKHCGNDFLARLDWGKGLYCSRNCALAVNGRANPQKAA